MVERISLGWTKRWMKDHFCVCVGGFKRKKVESREGQRVHKKTAHGKRMKYISAYWSGKRWCFCLKSSDLTIFFSFGDHKCHNVRIWTCAFQVTPRFYPAPVLLYLSLRGTYTQVSVQSWHKCLMVRILSAQCIIIVPAVSVSFFPGTLSYQGLSLTQHLSLIIARAWNVWFTQILARSCPTYSDCTLAHNKVSKTLFCFFDLWRLKYQSSKSPYQEIYWEHLIAGKIWSSTCTWHGQPSSIELQYRIFKPLMGSRVSFRLTNASLPSLPTYTPCRQGLHKWADILFGSFYPGHPFTYRAWKYIMRISEGWFSAALLLLHGTESRKPLRQGKKKQYNLQHLISFLLFLKGV